MKNIVSDEILIKNIKGFITNGELKQLLSVHGEVTMTEVDEDSTIVQFRNKNHVLKTFSELHIDLELRRRWICLPPRCPIMNGDESPIQKLSDDCLFKLFSYLPIIEKLNIERVCRRWRKIGSEGWPDIERLGIQSSNTFTEHQLLTIFQRCGRFIEQLDFPLDCSEYNVTLIEKYCHRLAKITFFTMQKNHQYLLRILRHANKLESLTVIRSISHHLNEYVQTLQPDVITELHFYPREYARKTDRPHSPDLSNFKNLRYLELTYYEINNDDFEGFKNLTNLTVLSLQDCKICEAIIHIIPNFVELEVLSLSRVICDINDYCIMNIARSCRKLKHLYLTNLQQLTDFSLAEIAQISELEFLELGNQSNFTANGIALLTQVKILSCLRCEGLYENDGLLRLIRNSSHIAHISADPRAFHQSYLQATNDVLHERKNGLSLEIHLINRVDFEQNRLEKEHFELKNLSPLLKLHVSNH